ncbi:MAG TPA: DUF1553 domain-containing protein, partial [Candidatus Saccharimonadales bacterium]|nr:DUF1553 domain-containing protein [Candidatus Saccharimonadales bacterium]
CHDHKFDPIRAQDYYALSGFMLGSNYRQVRFESMENNRKMAAELSSLREQYATRLAKLVGGSLAGGVSQISRYMLAAQKMIVSGETNALALASFAQEQSLKEQRLRVWIAHLNSAATNPTSPLHLFARVALKPGTDRVGRFAELVSSNQLAKLIALPPDSRVIADFSEPGRQPWKVDGPAFGSRPQVPGDILLGKDPANPIERIVTYGAAWRDLFWNRLKAAPGNENDSGTLAATSRSGQMLSTPTITLGVGKLHYLIQGKTRVYAGVDSHLMIEGPLHGRLSQVFDSGPKHEPRWVTHDLTPYSGHRVHVEFGPDGEGELSVLMVVEAAETPLWRPEPASFPPSTEVRSLADYSTELQTTAIAACKQVALGSIKTSSDTALANWLVQNPALFRDGPEPRVTEVGSRFLAAQSNIASRVRWESHTAVAWFDGTGVDENILVRGKPTKIGALAPRSLPAAFASAKPITTGLSSGRYELAQQLVDPANPLVARTIANRIWHHLFGRGIVGSVDNFGALGDRPTHPELLDHLAWQLVHEDAWSLKKLIKRIVLTQTFAMSSRSADARAEELDPSDALLHRMPIRRLEGEVIRDALLAVSGRFNPAVGGPPVTIYLTEFLVGRGRPAQSGPLDGDGRRSLYTTLHRNFLPTLMQTFDTPTPFSTVGKRNVTNVPAQSLALMNDPLFHQQARVWAERLMRETRDASDAARVNRLFESAYAREASAPETKACLESLAEFREFHIGSSAQAVESWSDLCHALLNANDFIYLK